MYKLLITVNFQFHFGCHRATCGRFNGGIEFRQRSALIHSAKKGFQDELGAHLDGCQHAFVDKNRVLAWHIKLGVIAAINDDILHIRDVSGGIDNFTRTDSITVG